MAEPARREIYEIHNPGLRHEMAFGRGWSGSFFSSPNDPSSPESVGRSLSCGDSNLPGIGGGAGMVMGW